MKIAIYGRPENTTLSPYIKNLFLKLTALNVTFLLHEPFYNYLKSVINVDVTNINTFKSNELLKHKIDYLLSIGGDGTFLETISLVKDSGIPILGINTGRLGFLASVSKDEINTALESLMNKEYTLDQRVLLRLETENKLFGNVNYALNEITIHKKDSSAMISIHAYLNGEYLNSYWADGLIISTPTGSTAYSLSCGGPIVIPDSENFIITPIAPHNLNVRPIVIPDNNTITLKVEGRSPNYLVSLDSRSEIIDSSVELTVKKENFKISLLKLNSQNFLNTIRNKLMWGIDKRNY